MNSVAKGTPGSEARNRAVAHMVVLPLVIFSLLFLPQPPTVPIGLLAGLLALAFAFAAATRSGPRWGARWQHHLGSVWLLVDGALVTLLVQATGPLDSPYFVLYYVALIGVVPRFGVPFSLLVALGYGSVYMAVLAANDQLLARPAGLMIRAAGLFMMAAALGLAARGFDAPRAQAGSENPSSRPPPGGMPSYAAGLATRAQRNRAGGSTGASRRPPGAWAWTIKENVVQTSAPFTEAFHIDPATDTPSLERFMDRIRDSDRMELARGLEAAIEGKQLEIVVHPWPATSGVSAILLTGRAEMGPEGNVRAVVGTMAPVVVGASPPSEPGHPELQRLKEQAEFRTQFLNAVAHELNTPLTPIRLQLNLLQRALGDSLPPAQKRGMEILTRNVERLSTLVGDVLDIARMQSGRLTMVKEPIDLGAIVAEAVESYQASCAQEKIALESEIESGLAVLADANRLSQVFFNLVGNAVKFTPSGGKIVVRAWSEHDEARVSVHDTGVGMTQQQVAQLFKPFSQVHESAPRGAKGSGLGLFISRGIMDLHGGKLTVASPGPSLGSTFTLTMPMAARGEGPARPPIRTVLTAAERTRQETFTRRVRELV